MANKYKILLEDWIDNDQKISEMVKNWLLEWANQIKNSDD